VGERMTLLSRAEPRPAGQPTSRSAPTSGHLYQVDVVRVLTFAAVVLVHAISITNGASRNAAAVGMLTHFTREVFFALTGFVLIYTQSNRPLHTGKFLWHRCSLVFVPYVLWTLIYIEFTQQQWPTTGAWWHNAGYRLLTGTAEFHLYFLLVTLQIYLVFPLFLRLIRATEGHHAALFVAALGWELAVTWALHGPGDRSSGFPRAIVDWSYALFPSYLFYVVAGALAAVHLPRWQQFADRHRWTSVWFLALAGIATLWVEHIQAPHIADLTHATEVLQPVMVLWSIAVAFALYTLGSAWVSRRRSRRAIAMLEEASLISFGVYLLHPLLLHVFADAWLGVGNGWIKAPASTVLLTVITLAASVVIVELLSRTPLSLALTGRRSRRRVRTRPVAAKFHLR